MRVGKVHRPRLSTTIPQLAMVSISRYRAGVCYTLYDPSLIHHVYNQLALGKVYSRKEETPGRDVS